MNTTSSRGQHLVRRMVGGQFDGHHLSDFYCGYNIYAGKQQRCWVHLLRDLHALKEARATDAAVVQWAQDVRGLVEQAHTLGRGYARAKQPPCCALAKRLERNVRLTLALVFVKPSDDTLTLLSGLLAYLRAAGIRIKCLYADKGFCSIPVLRWVVEGACPPVSPRPFVGNRATRARCVGDGGAISPPTPFAAPSMAN